MCKNNDCPSKQPMDEGTREAGLLAAQETYYGFAVQMGYEVPRFETLTPAEKMLWLNGTALNIGYQAHTRRLGEHNDKLEWLKGQFIEARDALRQMTGTLTETKRLVKLFLDLHPKPHRVPRSDTN